jgi:hypothetical protein
VAFVGGVVHGGVGHVAEAAEVALVGSIQFGK